ncbi:MAG TPA: LytR C-terminal domain-containing protein [Acidimicrobiales bacterium]|nr:LytR C-terminal domain-containing protein [Acidimicrobiales bacterium]
MTAPRGSSGDALGGRQPANAAARGALLVLVAVLIGVVLLARGFDDEGGLIADGGDDTADTSTDDTTDPGGDGDGDGDGDGATDTTLDGGDGTTDTTAEVLPPARPPEETTVLVLNGSGVSGAAGRVRDALLAANYNPLAPGNAPANVDATSIYYVDTWQAEAAGIASLLGAPLDAVQPMPSPPPFEFGEATVVIVLGADQVIAVAG